MTELRPLGTSGLATRPIVLGGNVFGWNVDDATGFAILDRFVDGGGTMIDTADVYTAWIPGHVGGESERQIGRWLNARGRRDDVLIVTKLGMLPGRGGVGVGAERIRHAVDESLERLQTDYVDLYFTHRDFPETPLEETLEALDMLVKAGKVRAIGASNYSADRLAQAIDVSAANGWAAYTVLQPLYNLVERDSFEGPLQHVCIDRTVGVIPYFSLAAGFLTGKYREASDLEGRDRGYSVKSRFNPRGLRILAAMDAVATETGATLPRIALAWLAAQPGVTAPIASATSLNQLDDLLGGLSLTLSADQLARLTAAGDARE